MENNPFIIYVVEDNEWYNKLLVHNLSLNPDFKVKTFFSGSDLLKSLSDKPDVITLDYRLPDIDGESLLKKIKDFDDKIEVVVISEQEDIETAVDLLKAGAYDYLVKSKDIKERLVNTINHIRKNASLKKQIISLQKEVQGKYAFEKSIVGNSPALKKVFDLIAKATETNITVTISGETGTGKEVVSKAIHYNSKRKDKPFVAVNHLEGHAISPSLKNEIKFPYLVLLISGGHSQYLIVKDIGKYEQLGTTIDDALGEAFDKTAKVLNLGYPGGPNVEKFSKLGDENYYKLPEPIINKGGCNLSFAGLKTAVLRQAKKINGDTQLEYNLAASFQHTINKILYLVVKNYI